MTAARAGEKARSTIAGCGLAALVPAWLSDALLGLKRRRRTRCACHLARPHPTPVRCPVYHHFCFGCVVSEPLLSQQEGMPASQQRGLRTS